MVIVMEKSADVLLKRLPEWEEKSPGNDMYYWYWGTYAMFQMGGKHWKAWNKAMKKVLSKSQHTKGEERGSWDPVGPWGKLGERLDGVAKHIPVENNRPVR